MDNSTELKLLCDILLPIEEFRPSLNQIWALRRFAIFGLPEFQSAQILFKLGLKYTTGNSISHKKFQLSWIIHLWIMGILVPCYVVKEASKLFLCSGEVRWPQPKINSKWCPTYVFFKNTLLWPDSNHALLIPSEHAVYSMKRLIQEYEQNQILKSYSVTVFFPSRSCTEIDFQSRLAGCGKVSLKFHPYSPSSRAHFSSLLTLLIVDSMQIKY